MSISSQLTSLPLIIDTGSVLNCSLIDKDRCRKSELPSLPLAFYGPFEIIQKIREAAHWLALPASSRIHLVFHVSQLKKYFRASNYTSKNYHSWTVKELKSCYLTRFYKLEKISRTKKEVEQALIQRTSQLSMIVYGKKIIFCDSNNQP